LGDARLIDQVEALMRHYQINPEQLTFEITETAIIGNLTQARRFAERVHELGCQLALDDFGSGHGSFRSLKLFPIDIVKIDGEFVENLVSSHQDQVMIQALVQICNAYGVQTLAEFVQDEATLDMLRELGVGLAQGYLIGKPQPVENLPILGTGAVVSPGLGRLPRRSSRTVPLEVSRTTGTTLAVTR
jgi:EAL domain-containing protein (putative c-di-GMP-specific phosphodiesterase class I)